MGREYFVGIQNLAILLPQKFESMFGLYTNLIVSHRDREGVDYA